VANSCSSVDSNDEEDADSEEDYDSNSESAAVLPPPVYTCYHSTTKRFRYHDNPPITGKTKHYTKVLSARHYRGKKHMCAYEKHA